VRTSTKVAKDRSERLHAVAREVSRKRNALWAGWQGQITIDEAGKVVQGRNYAYKPVVLSGSSATLGSKLQVQVVDYTSLSLKARILP
jgi:tRNA A37 methylthiotransferase MiaB